MSKAIPAETPARMTVTNNAAFIICEKVLRMESIHHSQFGPHAEIDNALLIWATARTHLEYRSLGVSGLEESALRCIHRHVPK